MDRRPGFALAFSYTLEFVKQSGMPIIVEPHWTLAYPPFVERLDMEAVWRRCHEGRLFGETVWLLSPTDMVFHLCLHLIHKADWTPLLWWIELDRLIRLDSARIDWSLMHQICRQAGIEGLVAHVLARVQAHFETPLPALFVQDIIRSDKMDPVSPLTDRLYRLLGDHTGVDGRESLAFLLMLPGLRAKGRYLRGILFPSRKFMQQEYGVRPWPVMWFNYAVRMLYFLWQGIKGLATLLRPAPASRSSL